MLNENHTYNLSLNETYDAFCSELMPKNDTATVSSSFRQEWDDQCRTWTNGDGEGLLGLMFTGMEKDVLCIARTRLDMKPCEPKLGPG